MDLNSASSSSYRPMLVNAIAGGEYSPRRILPQLSGRPSAPSQVTLFGDIFRDFVLALPMVVNLDSEDGKIIASDDVFYMYGEGSTRQEAVRDYLSSLAEYYVLLESYNDAPSVELFSYLQTYLRPKRTRK